MPNIVFSLSLTVAATIPVRQLLETMHTVGTVCDDIKSFQGVTPYFRVFTQASQTNLEVLWHIHTETDLVFS